MLSPAAARTLTLGIAGARALLGAVAIVAPSVALKPWVGEISPGDAPKQRLLARALGGRDIALGLGALLAWRRGRPFRGWVEAAALADSVDAASTLMSVKWLPKKGSTVVLLSAAGAAASGFIGARRCDETDPRAPKA